MKRDCPIGYRSGAQKEKRENTRSGEEEEKNNEEVIKEKYIIGEKMNISGEEGGTDERGVKKGGY